MEELAQVEVKATAAAKRRASLVRRVVLVEEAVRRRAELLLRWRLVGPGHCLRRTEKSDFLIIYCPEWISVAIVR